MLSGSQQDRIGSQQSSQQGANAANLFDAPMDRLWTAFSVDSDVKLAKALGKVQGSVSSARMKRSIPALWLPKIAEHGISIDWILFGIGVMRLDDLAELSTRAEPPAVDLELLQTAVAVVEGYLSRRGLVIQDPARKAKVVAAAYEIGLQSGDAREERITRVLQLVV